MPKPKKKAQPLKEASVLKSILIYSPLMNCTLFRNNVGMFSIDTKGKKRFVKTGLCKGSSDLIGYTSRMITKEMVGQRIAVFTAIETKKEEWKETKKFDEHEKRQDEFLKEVREKGGIAGFANSIEVFVKIIKGFYG